MESWLTVGRDDGECWCALGLAQSLSASGTTKNTTIFTGQNVSNEMRFLLGHFFDLVQPLPAEFKLISDLPTFTPWTKCVTLDANYIALENVDELFETSRSKDSPINASRQLEVAIWSRGGPRTLTKAKTKKLVEMDLNLLGSLCKPVFNVLFQMDTEVQKSLMKCCPIPEPSIPRSFENTGAKADLSEAIAIVGMSCRFPGANTLDEYWDILKNGKHTVTRFPIGRATFDIPGIEESVAGFLSCPIDEFDPAFFDIDPAEAWVIDPQQRLLLEVAWESVEDAGIDAATLRGTNGGVFVGNLLQDYERMIPPNDLVGLDETTRMVGNCLSGLSGRLSRFLGLKGPSISHEAGCSSGLGAMHLASESLLRKECDVALSGAVNLVILPRAYNTAVLSADFKCKTFDESADGFVSGEAVGVLVLKRYADAVRDGDRIRAVVRGTAMSNDGASLCYGTPNPEGHARTHKLALKKARVLPRDVAYVETHGTGTQKGDIGEVFGLAEAYGGNRKSPLLIGSVKPNIGHGEAAAAVGSLVKLVLSLENEAIPPNIFLNKVNPKIDLDSIPAQIPTQLTPWTGNGRLAGISSFSLTGSLVHAILQSAPNNFNFSFLNNESGDEKPQLICISAKTGTALEVQMENYVAFLRRNGSVKLVDVAMAANVCRTHFCHRIAVLASSVAQLIEKLESGDYLAGIGTEGGETVDVVAESGQWSKVEAYLENVGKSYVKGGILNWSAWFGRREKKVSLPFYPFERQKYWFHQSNFPKVMRKRIAESESLEPPNLPPPANVHNLKI